MAVMMGSLYNALIAAKVPSDQAQKAAEEIAAFDNKSAAFETRLGEMRGDLLGIKSEMSAIKTVVGIVAALQIMTFAGMVGLLWRGIAG